MYDAIVIGSGVGGLSCAGFLGRAGYKVAVLEQHTGPGGYAQSFIRGKYHWDAAIHYTSECGPTGTVTRLLDLLGVGGRVEFAPLDPDGYDQLHFPDVTFRVPSGTDRYLARLQEYFPHEVDGIRRYVNTITRIWGSLKGGDVPGSLSEWAAYPVHHPQVIRWAPFTVRHLLNATVRDPRLRAVLVGQRGAYGENPSRASVLVHAQIIGSFLDGTYAPKGGSERIVAALCHAVTSRGGELLLRTPAKKILVENGRVEGVLTEDEQLLRARVVISNADLWHTFRDLVGPEHLPYLFGRRLQRLQPSVGLMSVFLGTDLDLAALGLGSANHFLMPGYDIEAPLDEAAGIMVHTDLVADLGAAHAPPGHHTLTLLFGMPYGRFERWQGTIAMHRGPEYERAKEAIAAKVIAEVERRLIPGLSDHVTAMVVGTPLTNEHYVRTYRGGAFGPAPIPSQVGGFAIGPKTPIPGLWLTGANVGGFFGVPGSLLSGAYTAARIQGISPTRLVAGA